MEVLIPLVLFVLFLGAIVALIVLLTRYQQKKERERTHALQSSATLLGWQFADQVPLNYLPNLDNFSLFGDGHSKQIKNFMYGETNGVKTALFDYVYVVGHGKHQHTYHQSVVYFEPRNLSIPFFSLRPENVFHKIGAAFGYQDIDFGNRPTFSSKYLLRGADEVGIRNTFGDRLLAFYEANPGLSADGGGNQLFFFRQGFRTPPHEARSFLSWGSQLYDLFTP